MAINVSTTDIRFLAQSMSHNSGEMKRIVRMMQTSVDILHSWRDRDGMKFKELTTQITRQLLMHMDNYEKMSRFLNTYASKMDEAAREQARRMNNI